MTTVLVIDNYDSFTYNLVHALASAGATPIVRRNDSITRDEITLLAPDAIVLSPGPGHPGTESDFGVCAQLIREPLPQPMLGVCLGMQGMAHHTGAHVTAAPDIVHGESDTFTPQHHAIFSGLTGPVTVGRYHSLCVDADSLGPDWLPLGTTGDGTLMAMAHTQHPWIGVQFHPESILTPLGAQIIENFLAMT